MLVHNNPTQTLESLRVAATEIDCIELHVSLVSIGLQKVQKKMTQFEKPHHATADVMHCVETEVATCIMCSYIHKCCSACRQATGKTPPVFADHVKAVLTHL